MEIDCLGEMCPMPILKLQKILPVIHNGESCILVTDHSCTFRAVKEFCDANKLNIGVEEVMSGIWEIQITNKL